MHILKCLSIIIILHFRVQCPGTFSARLKTELLSRVIITLHSLSRVLKGRSVLTHTFVQSQENDIVIILL